MTISKLPHSFSEAELLALLETAEDIETTSWANDVPFFLSHFKLDQGSNKVSVVLLYKLYMLYSKHSVVQQEFTKTVAQFIEKTGNYFHLNIKPIRIAKVLQEKKEKKLLSFNSINMQKHYDDFVKLKDVKPGNTWVEGMILYEIYRFYCIDRKKAVRLSLPQFIPLSHLYFKGKKVGSSKTTWFQVDDEIIGRSLTQEDITRLNNRRIKHPSRREKIRKTMLNKRKKLDEETKNKKESVGISGIEPGIQSEN